MKLRFPTPTETWTFLGLIAQLMLFRLLLRVEDSIKSYSERIRKVEDRVTLIEDRVSLLYRERDCP